MISLYLDNKKRYLKFNGFGILEKRLFCAKIGENRRTLIFCLAERVKDNILSCSSFCKEQKESIK